MEQTINNYETLEGMKNESIFRATLLEKLERIAIALENKK